MATNIVHEEGDFYIAKNAKGHFEVYQHVGNTHAERCAYIGYTGDPGLRRAMQEIRWRQSVPPPSEES